MTRNIDAVLSALEQDSEAAIARLFEFLSISSISTDPAYDSECQRAAQWVCDQLSDIGFDAQVHTTDGKPMVVGESRTAPLSQGPRLLFYGHYDVQPADPLELWDSPPFEPRLADDPVNGRVIVARGASDDKGQLMTFLEAARAWTSTHGPYPLRCDCCSKAKRSAAALRWRPSWKGIATILRPTWRWFATRPNGTRKRRR